MTTADFQQSMTRAITAHESAIRQINQPDSRWFNGLYERYQYPIVTRENIPVDWRYDMNPATNPHFIERLGINAVLNAGAMEWKGKIVLVCRVEGLDRKSFFAICESDTGIDGFRFWDEPILLEPDAENPETNVYDMRLTRHEDGFIYGLFCAERKDPSVPASNTSAAIASCGIARTRDLVNWERLPNLVSNSPQQRNVVLHPELIDGKYALYTRPQDGFIDAGTGGGIGWALCDSMENAVIGTERIMDERVYHTIKEVKNGMGAPPIRTKEGWLHVAHAVRNCAAGLRYVLYAFLCDLKDPSRVIARPGGHLIAPLGEERVGDVSNVVFSNGMVARDNGDLFIYYASSDTRLHVATTTVDKLLDYVKNTPSDPLTSYGCVKQRIALIRQNRAG